MTDGSLSLTLLLDISVNDKKVFGVAEERLLFDAFKLSTQEDYAKYYYNKNLDKHVYNSILGWFSLNGFNIWEPTGAPREPLLYGINLIANFFRLCFEDIIETLNSLNKNKNIDSDTKKSVIKPTLAVLKKIIKNSGTASFGKAIISYLPHLYIKDDLHNIMDKKTNIFPFKNILIEFNINYDTFYKFRKAEPDDWISTTTGYELPHFDKDLLNAGYALPEFDEEILKETKKNIMEFLKSILNDDKVIDYLLWFVARCLDGSKSGNCQSFVIWNGN